jgi:hypothetical protein
VIKNFKCYSKEEGYFMISFTLRAQSFLLAFAMIISSHTVVQGTDSVVKNFTQCVCDNKIVSIIIIALIAAKIQLMTQSRVEYSYSYEEFKQEIEDLCSSFNIFDTATRAKIKYLVKKYFVGAECKIEDTTTRTKNEDGSVFTIKGKKLTQKPSGFMGLLDAYVLSQAKKIVEIVPVIAGLYVLVNDPYQTFTAATKKAMG